MPKLARTLVNKPAATTRPRAAARVAELLNMRLTARQHLWLLVVLLVLAVRAYFSQYRNSPLFDFPQMDGRVHHEWAASIASGEGMEPRAYPRPALLLPARLAIHADRATGRRCASPAARSPAALNCYLIARLATALAGFRTGLLAGLIGARSTGRWFTSISSC